MSKPINTPFTVHAPGPIDTRTQVSTYAGLASIAILYYGLKVYVVDEDTEYRYYNTGWQEWVTTSGGGSGVWGAITGVLADQTDLVSELDLKYNKTGGVITGAVDVLANVQAYNFLVYGSAPTVAFPYVELVDVPATASSTGTFGQMAWEPGSLYICVATNTWEIITSATF
tara:strand:- start:1024 stop:1536 length:513 start_codon:yes stop_codon:yes gene_type:complete